MAHLKVTSIRWLELETLWHFNPPTRWLTFLFFFKWMPMFNWSRWDADKPVFGNGKGRKIFVGEGKSKITHVKYRYLKTSIFVLHHFPSLYGEDELCFSPAGPHNDCISSSEATSCWMLQPIGSFMHKPSYLGMGGGSKLSKPTESGLWPDRSLLSTLTWWLTAWLVACDGGVGKLRSMCVSYGVTPGKTHIDCIHPDNLHTTFQSLEKMFLNCWRKTNLT